MDEKFRVGEITFLGKAVEKRRCGIFPWRLKTVQSSRYNESISNAAYSQFHSPSILTAASSTATRAGEAGDGSSSLSASRWVHCQIAPCESLTPGKPRTALVSRTDSPIEWRRFPKQRTGVGVRSFFQTSWLATSNVSLSRYASRMLTSRYDLLTSNILNYKVPELLN